MMAGTARPTILFLRACTTNRSLMNAPAGIVGRKLSEKWFDRKKFRWGVGRVVPAAHYCGSAGYTVKAFWTP